VELIRIYLYMIIQRISLEVSLPNQILGEILRFVFIVDVEYEKLTLFCSNCKIIIHELSHCRGLQQNTNVIFGGEKTVKTKIQQHYCPKVVDA